VVVQIARLSFVSFPRPGGGAEPPQYKTRPSEIFRKRLQLQESDRKTFLFFYPIKELFLFFLLIKAERAYSAKVATKAGGDIYHSSIANLHFMKSHTRSQGVFNRFNLIIIVLVLVLVNWEIVEDEGRVRRRLSPHFATACGTSRK
jgi:hypothetical protein